MALISEFRPTSAERTTRHEPVICGWRAFDLDGERLLQLDTYGRSDRAMPDKVSQSIQLDRDGAKELLDLIRRAFPEL